MSLANDKLSGGRRIIAGNSQLAAKCLAGGFKNVISADEYSFASGNRAENVTWVGETAPGSNYDTYVTIGDRYILLTFTSGAVSAVAEYIYTEYGWSQILNSGGPMTIDVTATTALAASSQHALRVKSKVPTGVTCGGHQSCIYLETEVTGTGTCSGSHYGLKIETYVTSGATITGDHYGIAVFTYSDIAGTQAIDCLRLEHNGASVANAFLNLQSAASKMSYLISSSSTNNTWCGITTTPTCATAGGWYRVKHGGYTRYIQLYTSVS